MAPVVDCLAVSCLTKGEAEPDKASGGAEDDALMHNDEGDTELDGEIVANVDDAVDGSEVKLGAPGMEEAVVMEGTEVMDSCEEGDLTLPPFVAYKIVKDVVRK
ncbi:hypothetical protein E2C01_021394 [Portunus trituberculatus]|uniref:Uncharacterized protein n=1 Tax=Portunus trituberculatus TaxID=210409 RepID=A0A5B7E4C8_PORTR|nr:hypothetical protein [Portunus trituberculatus]